mgnify:CR=1 FL=1
MIAKYSQKIAVLLLAMLFSLFIGSMVMEIQPHALFDSKDLTVDGDGTVKTGTDNTKGAFSKIIDKYKAVITFVSGIGAITMIGIFIFHFIKLGSTAANPSERSKCTTALIWSGLAAAGLGSVALIVGVFYGMLA